LSHNCIHSGEFTTVDLGSGREQVGVTQGRPGLNPAGTSAGTRLWKLTKPYSSNWLGLEAEVGIGRFTSVFTKKIYAFSPMNASTFALLLTFPNELINYPLTEGFTETFTEGFSAHARM
jgi:hypothetical protein